MTTTSDKPARVLFPLAALTDNLLIPALVKLVPTQAGRPALEKLTDLATKIRPHTLTNVDAIGGIWREIRQDEPVTDLLISLTFHYLLSLGVAPSERHSYNSSPAFEALLNALSLGMGYCVYKDGGSFMDDTLTERASSLAPMSNAGSDNASEIWELYRKNFWLVTLIVLGQMDYVRFSIAMTQYADAMARIGEGKAVDFSPLMPAA